MELSEEVFEKIKDYCDPKKSFNHILKIIFNEEVNNFSGGCGDLMTTHEKMFQLMNPDLDAQVVFGTGKGGYEEYGFKRVIVDFLDTEKNMAYEIDGQNHLEELQMLKDRIKSLFLYKVHGVTTYRITNEEVERLLKERILKLNEEGVLENWARSIGLVIEK